MSREISKISESLFEKIRSRFQDVSLGDEKAQATDDPEKARFFNFDYTSKDGIKFGNVTISLADDSSLKIYFSKNISKKLDDIQRKEWYDFLLGLRMFAKRNMLSFDTRDISRSSLELKDLKTVSKHDKSHDAEDVIDLKESKMYGTHRRSFQNVDNVRLIVNHFQPVDEQNRGARSRYIESIFVETAEGERFKMPFTKLSAARAAARHIANGGKLYDDIGQYIVNIVEEMGNMTHFVRSMRNRQFEDKETGNMVEAAIERYYQLNNQLHQMQGRNGYKRFIENFTVSTQEQLNEVDVDGLKEKFVKKVFDERLLTALPYVHKAYEMRKQRQADAVLEVKSIIEDNLPLILQRDSVQDSIMNLRQFKENSELVKGVLEDIANRSISPRLAEFAKKWSENFENLTENGSEEINEEQRLAVQLAARYLRDLSVLQKHPTLVNEIRTQEVQISKPPKNLVQEFENWADTIIEGTWALPQTDEDFRKLQELFNSELQVGVDAENASSSLYNLIGDDALHDWLYSIEQAHGPEYDIRMDLASWLQNNMPEVAARLDFSKLKNQVQSTTMPNIGQQVTKNGAPAQESTEYLRKLAGI